jgi:hypothetical protein
VIGDVSAAEMITPIQKQADHNKQKIDWRNGYCASRLKYFTTHFVPV